MKRGEKSGEEPAEKREILGEKLRVGKRGGHTTPVAHFWRPNQFTLLIASAPLNNHGGGTAPELAQDFVNRFRDNPLPIPCVSVRKLGATLWELNQYNLPFNKMHNGIGVPPPRLRRLNHHRQQLYADDDPSPIAPEMPGSSSSLRRHIVASLMQHHRSIERSNHAMQPVSPASYGSSMEITPYNPVATPTSSIEFRGPNGDTSFSLKTSTGLLKVLNRIWSLEEQHVSNMALVKTLKKDLEYARFRIKELVRSQHADRREMDDMMKQITEDKLVRKNKEQDRIIAAIEAMRGELEDERKLRKRSESLHRKIARELYDVKATLANVSNELDKEQKSRNLLEDLCDEFAWGVRDYEKELHGLKQVSVKDWAERADRDQLILHVSESWLDERMQTGEKKSALDKLRPEIEALLEAKRNGKNKTAGSQIPKDLNCRRSSLESIPLNMVVSAPRDEENDNDSVGSDSNCFELEKMRNEYQKSNYDETNKQKQVKKKLAVSERPAGQTSSLQVKFDEQMVQAMSHGEDAEQITNEKGGPLETKSKPEKCEMAKESSSERKNEPEKITGLNSNHMLDNLIRNHYLLTESGSAQPDKNYAVGSSIWRSHPSPVRKWTEKLPSHDLDVSESSSKLPPDLKQNTLRSKLMEARTRGHRSRSRPKTSLIPSRKE